MATDVESFKNLYHKEFGITLTDEEAEQKARMLVCFYIAVYGSPVIKENKL